LYQLDGVAEHCGNGREVLSIGGAALDMPDRSCLLQGA
jgi:hypothetical protein